MVNEVIEGPIGFGLGGAEIPGGTVHEIIDAALDADVSLAKRILASETSASRAASIISGTVPPGISAPPRPNPIGPSITSFTIVSPRKMLLKTLHVSVTVDATCAGKSMTYRRRRNNSKANALNSFLNQSN
jgi:hypothetical protein